MTTIADLRNTRLALWLNAKSLAEQAAFEQRGFTLWEQCEWRRLGTEMCRLDDYLRRLTGVPAGERLVSQSEFPEERGKAFLVTRKLIAGELLA